LLAGANLRSALGEVRDREERLTSAFAKLKTEKAKATAAAGVARRAEGEAKAEQARAGQELRRAETALYAKQLAEAQRAIAGRQFSVARALLDACPWHLRGWEHDYLRRRCDPDVTSWPAREAPRAARLPAFVAAGPLAALPTLPLLADEPGVHTLPDPAELGDRVVWGPDGKRLATIVQRAGRARVWDVATGACLADRTTDAADVAFSPDGRCLCLLTRRLALHVLHLASGKALRLWEPGYVLSEGDPLDVVRRATLSPDGRHVAAVATDWRKERQRATLWVWDVLANEQRLEAPMQMRNDGSIGDDLVFSPDGKWLAATDAGGARVWDVASGREVLARKMAGRYRRLAFSPDGTRLYAVHEGESRAWDLATGREATPLALPSLHDGSAQAWLPDRIRFSPDGRRALLFKGGGYRAEDLRLRLPPQLRIHDIATGVEVLALGEDNTVADAAFSPDGRRLAVAFAGRYFGARVLRGRTTKVWDAPPPAERRPSGVGGLPPQGLPTGTPLLAVEDRLLDTRTGRLFDLSAFSPGPDLETRLAAATPDGRRVALVATHEPRRGVVIVDVAGAREVCRLQGEGLRVFGPFVYDSFTGRRSSSTLFSPDGRHLALHTKGGLRVFDAGSGKEPRRTSRPALPASPDDVLPDSFPGGGPPVAALSPDASRLAFGSGRLTSEGGKKQHWAVVELFDTATGRAVHTWRAPITRTPKGFWPVPCDLTFSPDGRHLVSARHDGTVQGWDTGTGRELFTLRVPAVHPEQMVSGPDILRHTGVANVTPVVEAEQIVLGPGTRLALLSWTVRGYECAVTVWDSAAGKVVGTHRLAVPSSRLVRLAPKGDFLVWLPVNDRMPHLVLLSLWDDPPPAPVPPPDYFRAVVSDSVTARREFEKALARLHENWKSWRGVKHPDDPELLLWDREFRVFHTRYIGGEWPIYHSVSSPVLGYNRLLERFGGTDDPSTAAAVVRTCNLLPEAVSPPGRVLPLAERAAAADPKSALHVSRHGAALYRAGEHKRAVARLNEAVRLHGKGGTAYDWLFLAMAHHKLDWRGPEARRWLARAVRFLEGAEAKRLSPEDRLELEMLRRQAEPELRR
jgi:WD40 repeat protein